jgi:hypothetical protein
MVGIREAPRLACSLSTPFVRRRKEEGGSAASGAITTVPGPAVVERQMHAANYNLTGRQHARQARAPRVRVVLQSAGESAQTQAVTANGAHAF